MNKNIIKLIIILSIIILLIFVAKEIINTYAIFQSELYGTLEIDNANWTIKINNEDISSGVLKEFAINNISIDSNSKVKANKIAPNTSGKFYINIDPENTDVSIRYDITINKEEISKTGAIINSVKEIQNNKDLILTGENTYTGVIWLNDIKNKQKDKLEFSIIWENIEENNENDTSIGTKEKPKINIPIEVKVYQYLGEVITPI